MLIFFLGLKLWEQFTKLHHSRPGPPPVGHRSHRGESVGRRRRGRTSESEDSGCGVLEGLLLDDVGGNL